MGGLLVLYVSEIILFSLSAAYYNSANILTGTYRPPLWKKSSSFGPPPVTNPQVLGMSFCNVEYNLASKIGEYKYIPRLVLSGFLFVLAVVRLCTEAFQSYRVTGRWQVNRYIKLLVREGVLYFLVYVPSPLCHDRVQCIR